MSLLTDVLKQTFNTYVTASKKLLYILLVRSQLIYCSQLWQPYFSRTLLEIIQSVQPNLF